MSVCDRIRPELKAYVDGQSSALSRLTIRWHLSHCADCRREVEEMERISNELREEDEGLAPALRARILAALPDGLPDAPDRPSLRPRWQKPVWVLGGLATAVLAALFFLPHMGLFGGEESTPSASTSAKSSAAAPPTASGGRPLADSEAAAKKGGEPEAPAASHFTDKTKSSDSFKAMAGAPPPGAMSPASSAMPTPPIPAKNDFRNTGSFGSHRAAGGGGSFGSHPNAGPGGSFGNPQSQPNEQQKASAPTQSAASFRNHPAPPADGPADPPGPAGSPGSPGPAGPAGPPALARPGRINHIHYETTLTLLVADVAAQSSEIERLGKAAGGSVSRLQTKDGHTKERQTSVQEFTLTVPAAKFESMRKQIALLGVVQSEQINNKDLTAQIMADEKAADSAATKGRNDNGGASVNQPTHDRNSPPKPEGDQAKVKNPTEVQVRLQALRESTAQATITIRLTVKSQPARKD